MERNVKQQMGSLSETFVGLITESQTTNHHPSELTGSDVREVSRWNNMGVGMQVLGFKQDNNKNKNDFDTPLIEADWRKASFETRQ